MFKFVHNEIIQIIMKYLNVINCFKSNISCVV